MSQLSGCSLAAIRLYSPALGAKQVEGLNSTQPKNLTCLPGGANLALTQGDEVANLWDGRTFACQQKFDTTIPFCSLAFGRDDEHLDCWVMPTSSSRPSPGYSKTAARTTWHGCTSSSQGSERGQELMAPFECRLRKAGLVSVIEAGSHADKAGPGSLPSTFRVPGSKNDSNAISIQEDLICRGDEKIMWLPSDYRPTCAVVRDDMLVLGHQSGQATFIKLDLTCRLPASDTRPSI